MSHPDSTTSTNQPPTFEQSLAQLQKIVIDLENGALGLEESLGRFEQGVGLLKTCYLILEQAEQRIEVLTGFDRTGQPRTTPFDASATLEQTPASTRKPPSKRSSKSMFVDSE